MTDFALEWYGDEIADNITNALYNWDYVKRKMVRRFGSSTAQPLIEAKEMRLSRDQTLEQYFRAKVRLLNQTSIDESEKIQMLTDGLPLDWKKSFAPIPINTTDTWFESAQKVEAVHSKPTFKKDNHFKPNFKPQYKPKPQKSFQLKTFSKYSEENPPLCDHCRNIGLNEYHWHRNCPNKTKRFGNQQPSGSRHTYPKSIDYKQRKPIKGNQSSTQALNNTSGSEDENTFSSSNQNSKRKPKFDRCDHLESIPHSTKVSSATVSTEQLVQFVDVEVKLNGVRINSFVDSGSTISVTSEKTLKRLNVAIEPNSSIPLNQVSGKTRTVGSFKAQLQIANRVKPVTIHVISGFKYPLLLGLDVGRQFGLLLDLKDCKVSMASNNSNNPYTSLNLSPSEK